MGTTSEKLTYLNTTKTLIKEELNLGGANITTEPFRQYKSKLEGIYKDFLAHGTDVLWNNWEKVSGTGETLSLTPTIKGRIQTDLKGNTQQNGTPTPDQPIPVQVVSGDNSIKVEEKNLLNPNDNIINLYWNDSTKQFQSDSHFRSVVIKVKPNTAYTVSRTEVYERDFSLATSINYPVANDYATNTKVVWSDTTLTNTITTGANDNYLLFYFGYGINESTSRDLLSKCQLELGNQATTYTPYVSQTLPISLGSTELCKIGTYQDYIRKSTGKNYYKGLSFTRSSNGIDFTYNLDGSINANGTSTGNALSMVTSEATPYLITLSAGTYTISGGKSNIQIQLMDKNGNNLAETTSSSFSKNFTLNSETQVYVRLLMPTGKSASNEKIYPMLNTGQTALPYEPYGKVWYLHKEIGKVVLDGSENWSLSSLGAGKFYLVLSNNFKLKQGSGSIGIAPLSSHFLGKDNSSDFENNYAVLFYTNYTPYLRMENDDTPTLSNWETWLSNNNTTVYYVLATQTNTEITDSTLLGQLNNLYNANSYDGTTNVSQVNDDMPFILDLTCLKEIS